jgi:CRP-like cAMP-binding protein
LREATVTSRIVMLAGLMPDETAYLLSVARPIHLRAGERVFSEGDEGDELFIVRTGRVRITKTISPDVQRTLALVEAGGVFGDMVIVEAGPRSATAEAQEPSEILGLDREAFKKLVTDRPDLGIKFLGKLAASLAERLRLTNDLLRDTLAFSLEVSGAASLSLAKVMGSRVDVAITLVNGRTVAGRILKVDRSNQGIELTIRTGEGVSVVPYHAIAEIACQEDVLETRAGKEG